MMLNKQHRGLWMLVCDNKDCYAKFELNGYWDITPSKQNTIRVARQRRWYVGKEKQFCSLHRPHPKRAKDRTNLDIIRKEIEDKKAIT